MCLRIFIPTPRRLILFLVFLVVTLSGILSFLLPFQHLLGLPTLLIPETYTALLAQAIYSYILACIYAFAYVWLEASIRRRYPHMNDIVQKKRQEPVQEFQEMPPAEEPVSKEPPAIQEPAKRYKHRHAKARTRKKPAKRRKR